MKKCYNTIFYFILISIKALKSMQQDAILHQTVELTFHNQLLSYDDAMQACNDENSTLVSITDNTKQHVEDIIKQKVKLLNNTTVEEKNSTFFRYWASGYDCCDAISNTNSLNLYSTPLFKNCSCFETRCLSFNLWLKENSSESTFKGQWEKSNCTRFNRYICQSTKIVASCSYSTCLSEDTCSATEDNFSCRCTSEFKAFNCCNNTSQNFSYLLIICSSVGSAVATLLLGVLVLRIRSFQRKTQKSVVITDNKEGFAKTTTSKAQFKPNDSQKTKSARKTQDRSDERNKYVNTISKYRESVSSTDSDYLPMNFTDGVPSSIDVASNQYQQRSKESFYVNMNEIRKHQSKGDIKES